MTYVEQLTYFVSCTTSYHIAAPILPHAGHKMANVGSDVNNYSKTELCVMVIFPKLVNLCQGIF